MKILFTCLSDSWGGMEMYTLTTILQLRERNVEAELLCKNSSRLKQEAEKYSIKTYTSNFRSVLQFSEIYKTLKLINDSNYDLIHCEASKDLWLVVPALKLLRSSIPVILSKHVGSYIVKKDLLHKWIYNRLTLATAISSVIKKNLLDTTSLREDKIELLYNGIDTNKFDCNKTNREKVRAEFSIGNDTILLGMMARFSPGKGHEEFLIAAESLSEKHENLRFMIVGEPSKGEDSYAAQIKNMAAKLKCRDKIIFTGYRNDTPDIYAAMDIFVFPSHAEAFGLALVEAMSMSLSTVCSNSDGVLDIALDGKTSFLFNKQNSADLTSKLNLLIENSNLRFEFGKNARLRAVELFELSVFTNKLIELYKRYIKEDHK